MENSGEQIIAELRQRVEEEAQRKSEKLKTENPTAADSNSENANHNLPVSTNIFNNLKKPESVSLFGGERKSVNLFQIKSANQCGLQNGGQQTTQNIFNMTQKPIIQATDENDSNNQKSENEESQTVERSQAVFKSEPDMKIMKYDYKNQLVKILEMPIRKFKNGIAIAKQQIYITLEKLQNQPSTLYLLVRSNATKVLIYQGIIIKNISKLEHFMGKSDNLKFDVIKKNTNTSSEEKPEPKMIREVVKLQFLGTEQCEQFQKTVGDYFSLSKI